MAVAVMTLPLPRDTRALNPTMQVVIAEDTDQQILVVDADEASCAQWVAAFQAQGWEAHGVHDAAAMDAQLAARSFDVLVLDQILPGEGGLSICRRLSRSRPQLGMVFLSQCSDETDRIVALELGADDYIVKPCNPRELVARVRAFLRRRTIEAWARDADPDTDDAATSPDGVWTLNPMCNSITAPSGREIHLAGAEMALLNVMVDEPGALLSRSDLLTRTRGHAEVNYPRVVDITVSRVRRKVAEVEPGRELVRTIRGRGYVLTAKVVVNGLGEEAGAIRRQAARA